MKRILITFTAAATLATAAWAMSVVCPMHTYATCYNTYQMSPSGTADKWHCVCGDDVWVRR